MYTPPCPPVTMLIDVPAKFGVADAAGDPVGDSLVDCRGALHPARSATATNGARKRAAAFMDTSPKTREVYGVRGRCNRSARRVSAAAKRRRSSSVSALIGGRGTGLPCSSVATNTRYADATCTTLPVS